MSLVDFGATREYTKEFMDKWLRLLQAAAFEDRGACARWSLELGYLTGNENEVCFWLLKRVVLIESVEIDDAGNPYQFHDHAWHTFQSFRSTAVRLRDRVAVDRYYNANTCPDSHDVKTSTYPSTA